jgi:hypothetical protein
MILRPQLPYDCPMASRFQLPAIQLAGLAVLGSLVMASAFVETLPFDRWFHDSGWLVRLLLILPTLVGGAALFYITQMRFVNGMQNGIWSEEEVAPIRAFFTSSWMVVFSIGALVAYCVLMFIAHRRYQGLGLALFIVMQCFTRLGMAFRRKTPQNPVTPQWSGLSPLQSEHWGER